jgi:hypothetical protein
MSITASNVGQNNGVVMPVAAQVSQGVVYGWPDTRTGTLDPGASPPAAPSITGVVDNLDQDSVTVSLTTTPETNTVQLYYRQTSTSAWTTGLTRVGSGDIVQTGLVAGTWYEMYATAKNPSESAPSNLVTIYLSQADGVGTLKSAIYSILMGDSSVQALVDGRVGPGGDPVEGKTSIVFHIISSVPGHTMDGPDTLITPTLQVNSYGLRDYQAEEIADAVRGALNGFSGTVNGVSISYIALNDEGDLDDFEPGNRRVSRHGVRQDYLVTYTEN